MEKFLWKFDKCQCLGGYCRRSPGLCPALGSNKTSKKKAPEKNKSKKKKLDIRSWHPEGENGGTANRG